MTTTAAPTWTLRPHAEPLRVHRFESGAAVPPWVWGSGDFVSVTRTGDELSIVCSAGAPADAEGVGPYTAYLVDQQLDFGLTGVLCALLDPLAAAEISILALSTYDTDWILVPADQAAEAVAAWRRRGHTVL